VADNPIFAYWYYHLPNFVLAALMYTLLGRFILTFFVPPGSTNYIYRAFTRLTDPVLAVVRPVTPLAVPPLVLVVFAAVWLFVARLVLLIVLHGAGWAPPV